MRGGGPALGASLVLATLASRQGAAQAPEPAALSEVRVELVDGVRRTRPWAIQRLMRTQAGQPLVAATIERDLARLAATNIIYDPQFVTEQTTAGPRLVLRVKDKWSPLPFLNFRRGGARTTTAFGILESNTLGRLFTVSGEINSNARIPFVARSSADRIGHVVSVIVPRAGGSPFSPGAFWMRDFYDFGRWNQSGAREFVYDRARHRYLLQTRIDLSDLVTASIGAVTFNDTFRRNGLYRTSPMQPPVSGRSTAALAELQLGYIRENLSRFRGKQIVIGLEAGRRGWAASDFTYATGSAAAKAFFTPREGHNVAAQLVGAATTGRGDSHLLRAGGLSEIRGYRDGYFVGQQLVRTNLEYRIEVLEHHWPFRTITQVAAFVDGGMIRSRADAVAGLDYKGPIASAGGGVRVNLVPLARATGRADLAFGLYPRRRFDVAFGVQQFF